MTAVADTPPVSATTPAPQQNNFDDLKNLCEKIKREVTLTPPSIVEALCKGVPTRRICLEATFAEEVLEIARMLGRSHLLRFEDCE
jgi:hypothetical protein